ncbi:hypothetical protein N9C62_10265 [Luminiphilus sp.]|nr:hypothetical protein [Luminiphilus sp.]
MSEIYPIAVPKWGIEMVEGTITTWNKSEGDTVAKGDEVFEMESDKIVNVWDSPVAGVLRRVIAAAGDAHPVGALLGVIAAADVSIAPLTLARRPRPPQPTPRRRNKLHKPHKPAMPIPDLLLVSVVLPMSSA